MDTIKEVNNRLKVVDVPITVDERVRALGDKSRAAENFRFHCSMFERTHEGADYSLVMLPSLDVSDPPL